MKKLKLYAALVTCMVMAGLGFALEKASRGSEVVIVTIPDTSTTVCVQPSSFQTEALRGGRKEVCWKANWASTVEKAYVDNADYNEDETTKGWPIVGSEKECHDWGPNIPVCFWLDDSIVGAREIRVLGAN